MRSSRLYCSFLCALVAVFPLWCTAQTGSGTQGSGVRILPPAAEIASPFAVNSPSSERADAIAFLSPDAMTAPDRQAVRDASAAIAKNAAVQGFNLQQGSWSFQQIACPVFPGHLLLLYTRDRGVGDLSKFSAIVSRGENGSVRILPILRRSFSLYTPAPVNPLTIVAFNVLRADENRDRKVDWLATGLCYAALTGDEVKLPPAGKGTTQQNVALVMDSLLQVEEDGGAVVRFFDVEDPQRTRSWALSFDRNGKLMRVAVAPVLLKTALVP